MEDRRSAAASVLLAVHATRAVGLAVTGALVPLAMDMGVAVDMGIREGATDIKAADMAIRAVAMDMAVADTGIPLVLLQVPILLRALSPQLAQLPGLLAETMRPAA